MTARTCTPKHAARPAAPDWTEDQVRALGPTTDVVTAGQILGISRTCAYRLARTGTFPVPVVKAGAQYRVSVAALLAAVYRVYPPPAHTATQHPR